MADVSVREALGCRPGDAIAIVGAGGKTTLAYLLVRDAVDVGDPVVLTTTTQIWQPARGVFDELSFGGGLPPPSEGWRSACVTGMISSSENDTPVAGAYMPTVQTRLSGLHPADVCALHLEGLLLVIEADNARGLPLKVPGTNEPVIPPCSTLVCVLASLEALGRPLDDRVVARSERITALTGAARGSLVTPAVIVDLLTHAQGGMKGIPPGARRVAVLTQHSEIAHPEAAQMLDALLAAGYDGAVLLAPRAARPVLAVR